MSKGKLLLLQHEADEYGLNIKTVSYCGELLFLTQLPNTLCNRTPGWLLISSTWSLPALPARSRETTVSGWTFQSLAGHHHLPYLQALWQHTFETLLQTSLLAGRKDLRFPPQIRKGLFNLIDLSSPQWGASTNSQFRKRPKGGLEKRTGTEDEATPRFLFCWGLSAQLQPLFGRDLNSSAEGTPVGKHTLENVSDTQIILDDWSPQVCTFKKKISPIKLKAHVSAG